MRMMRSRILVLFFISTFLTQPVLAASKAGMIVSVGVFCAGVMSLLSSVTDTLTAQKTAVCPKGTQKAVSGTYDCSYQNIQKTCDTYACQDQATGQFHDYVLGKNQTRYDNAMMAQTRSAALTAAGFLAFIVSAIML